MSINAKGLNSPLKTASLAKEIKSFKGDIIFVQETHLFSENALPFQLQGIPHIYQAGLPSKKKGVMVAYRDSVDVQVSNSIADPQGRHLILICKINDTPHTLVNIYAFNEGQVRFLKRLLAYATTYMRVIGLSAETSTWLIILS